MGNTDAKNDRSCLSVRTLLLKLSVMLLALCAFLHVGVAQAYADDIGSITIDGTTKNYSKLEDLANALEGYGDKTLTIDMLADWNASYGKEDLFDHRLYIPQNCNVTFNMHGHIFDRDNVYDNDNDNDGELIYVDTGTTLTINGYSTDEESMTVHDRVHVFYRMEQETAQTRFITVNGGCLAGGNGSCGTGGIYINTDKDVALNNVTIAGCKATYHWYDSGFNSGYGAGIIITHPNAKLKMNQCLLTGCLAEEDEA